MLPTMPRKLLGREGAASAGLASRRALMSPHYREVRGPQPAGHGEYKATWQLKQCLCEPLQGRAGPEREGPLITHDRHPRSRQMALNNKTSLIREATLFPQRRGWL